MFYILAKALYGNTSLDMRFFVKKTKLRKSSLKPTFLVVLVFSVFLGFISPPLSKASALYPSQKAFEKEISTYAVSFAENLKKGIFEDSFHNLNPSYSKILSAVVLKDLSSQSVLSSAFSRAGTFCKAHSTASYDIKARMSWATYSSKYDILLKFLSKTPTKINQKKVAPKASNSFFEYASLKFAGIRCPEMFKTFGSGLSALHTGIKTRATAYSRALEVASLANTLADSLYHGSISQDVIDLAGSQVGLVNYFFGPQDGYDVKSSSFVAFMESDDVCEFCSPYKSITTVSYSIQIKDNRAVLGNYTYSLEIVLS